MYCKDGKRKGSAIHERFDFLGYTFRCRSSRSKEGKTFLNFSPAIGDGSAKAVRQEIRSWRLHLRNNKTLDDLAAMFNVVVQGWINYYGRFYRSKLYFTLKHINEYLVRWAMQKYKRLRGSPRRAWRWLASVARRAPNLFAHWRFGARPGGWAMGAG